MDEDGEMEGVRFVVIKVVRRKGRSIIVRGLREQEEHKELDMARGVRRK